MKTSTLHAMTTELCGRTVNSAIEEHLPQFAGEVEGLLTLVRAAARKFPQDLAPAAVFSLKPDAGESPSEKSSQIRHKFMEKFL